jgi:hypothetical protein
MAKRAKTSGRSGKIEVIRIDSVKQIRQGLQQRLAQTQTLVSKLKKGATVLAKPQNHPGPALASAKRIERQLRTAIKLMDKTCGNNDLSTPYKIQPKPGTKRRTT